MAVASPGCGPAPYCRRHPEQTVLYQVVQQHLETYLALAGEDDWDGQRVPAYVEREFRHSLECGILAYGFARARCPDCGHDFLVAFSCKGRGLCPSCNARRMAETAAHLVDHVIPPLPVRQWVLSVPKRLRWYLEREPRAISAVLHSLLRVSGFSLDAAVRVGAHDRAGLERLLRYCARPTFALERLERLDDERVVYRLPKPQRDGTTALTLTPLELIDHLAALIPPPRRHRHRYHGVLAPNAPLRAAAIAFGREVAHATGSATAVSSPPRAPASNARSPARYLWAMLLARLFESLPLVCPNCGADMRIIAFVTEAVPVQRILAHIGEPTEPPPIASARGPPAWDEAPEPAPDWDLLQLPESDFEFDQRIAW